MTIPRDVVMSFFTNEHYGNVVKLAFGMLYL